MDWITLTHAEIENDALPDACVHCGAEASSRHNQTFEWHPEWAGWLLLAGFVPGLVAIALTQRKRRVSLPVCPLHDHQRRKRMPGTGRRTALMLLLVLAFVPLGVAVAFGVWRAGGGLATPLDVGLAGGLGGLVLGVLVGLAIALRANPDGEDRPKPARPLVVQEITADGISLEGVSDGFVKAMRERRQRGSTGTLPMEQ